MPDAVLEKCGLGVEARDRIALRACEQKVHVLHLHASTSLNNCVGVVCVSTNFLFTATDSTENMCDHVKSTPVACQQCEIKSNDVNLHWNVVYNGHPENQSGPLRNNG